LKLFGWEILPQNKPEANNVSFAPEIKDDGAVNIAAGGSYGTYIDLEGTIKSESELVTRYREMALHAEVRGAIDDIVNEAIVVDQDYIVRLNLDKLEGVSDPIKDRLVEEFEEILDLFNFNNDAYEIFKRWYIDGRLYYHAIQDPENPRNGLKELRYIDPRKIRKMRETIQVRDPDTGAILTKTGKEYFFYSERGFPLNNPAGQATIGNQTAQALKISVDSILHCTSGLMDVNNQMVLSYLQEAIKPLNQLRVLEDATVIYRLSRAPERRIFYIDVGNMPKAKAEQYMRDMMVRHKNRLVYDAATGEVRDDRKYMTMLEDYWLPRREGGKGTEISTLPAGENLGELTDVNYFLKKLMRALGVPISRLDPEQGMSLGRASEITRDEVKFSKFVARMRKRFCQVFIKAMEKNLVLKGVCTQEEWADWSRHIQFEFEEDNHFAELKDNEIMNSRIELATALGPFVGAYYSHDYVRKHVFKQSDEEIEEFDEQIQQETADPRYKKLDQAMNPDPMAGMMGPDGMPMGQDDPFGAGGDDPFGPTPPDDPNNPFASAPGGNPNAPSSPQVPNGLGSPNPMPNPKPKPKGKFGSK